MRLRPGLVDLKDCSNPGRNQTHVNPPKQPNTTQKYDSAMNRDEAKADDRCNWPDLVSHNDDVNSLLENL